MSEGRREERKKGGWEGGKAGARKENGEGGKKGGVRL